MKLLVLALLLAPAYAAEPRALIAGNTPKVDRALEDAIWNAACRGEMEGSACNACPEDAPLDEPQPYWALLGVIPGHFLSAVSEDAFLLTSGCGLVLMPGTNEGMALMSKRDGVWKLLAYEPWIPGECQTMKFRSGAQALLCENRSIGRDDTLHSVALLRARQDKIEWQILMTAQDTRSCCANPQAIDAELLSLEFRQRGLIFTAEYGTLEVTESMAETCRAEGGRYVMPHAKRKRYRVRFHFDGDELRPDAADAAAAKLFQRRD